MSLETTIMLVSTINCVFSSQHRSPATGYTVHIYLCMSLSYLVEDIPICKTRMCSSSRPTPKPIVHRIHLFLWFW